MSGSGSVSHEIESTAYTREEVAKHNKEGDAWIIIDAEVYDVSKFLKAHPGGIHALKSVLGTDTTKDYFAMHNSKVLEKYQKLKIGHVKDEKPKIRALEKIQKIRNGGFSKVPFGDPTYVMGAPSAYYNASHIQFRKDIRKVLEQKVIPEALESEEDGDVPEHEIWKIVGQAGHLAARVGKSVMKPEWMGGIKLPGGLPFEKFDYFHEQIAHEEYGRFGAPSYADGLGAGYVIGLPPIIHFAKPELQQKVIPACVSGEKRICLAISEPWVGSDVANLRTVGKLSEDGKFWIVNGAKKWITNGVFCDYFVTAVRTGGKGMKGISLMCIERTEGLNTKAMKTAYGSCAGTAYVTYDDVKVPVENVLGEVNDGFKCVMFNFNHERWFIIAQLQQAMRLNWEDCMLWCNQREVFGKNLFQQPVLRQMLARILAGVESVQALTESITYQMNNMDQKTQNMMLAGPIALLKYQATRFAWQQADLAAQIFGGRAITKTGLGFRIERFIRANKYSAILGGSEEIMADLSVRMANKMMPKNARM